MLRRLPVFEDVLFVSVELVALVAVGWLPRYRIVVWLVGGDDAAVLAERLALEHPEIMAGVVDPRRHQNGRAPVVVQTRLESEVLDDVGNDALLALPCAHQLLHRRPVFTDYGFLEIVQISSLSARTTH